MSLGAILLFLVLLGGLIAYAGDVIGRRVGRRHVRLFGLRPRATGLLVAVLSGMLVAVVVFAAFMLLAKSARETILEAEKVRRERDALLAERSRLAEQVENLKAQAARAFAAEESARQRERRLAERLAHLESERSRLEGELAEVRGELAAREERLAELSREAESVKAELARMQEESERLRAELGNLRTARDEAERRAEEAMSALAQLKSEQSRLAQEVLVLERRARTLQGDLAELDALRRELERKNADLREQNESLSRLLNESRLEAARLKGQVAELARRGGELERGLSKVVQGEVLAEVYLSHREDPEEELRRALRQARARAKIMGLPELVPGPVSASGWQGPGLILVVAEGATPDGRIRVGARFVPSRTLFEPGEVIAVADLPEDPAKALEALVRLRRRAEERLLGLGVPEHHLLQDRISDRELLSFLEQVRGERARVAVVARGLVTTTGPLRLGLARLD